MPGAEPPSVLFPQDSFVRFSGSGFRFFQLVGSAFRKKRGLQGSQRDVPVVFPVGIGRHRSVIGDEAAVFCEGSVKRGDIAEAGENFRILTDSVVIEEVEQTGGAVAPSQAEYRPDSGVGKGEHQVMGAQAVVSRQVFLLRAAGGKYDGREIQLFERADGFRQLFFRGGGRGGDQCGAVSFPQAGRTDISRTAGVFFHEIRFSFTVVLWLCRRRFGRHVGSRRC